MRLSRKKSTITDNPNDQYTTPLIKCDCVRKTVVYRQALLRGDKHYVCLGSGSITNIMESERRFLIKNKAKYVDGSWYWGEEAEFGPESDYAIYLGDNSYVAARKLLATLETKKDYEKDNTE